MINRLHSWIHQPGKGWDPVAPEYAGEYAESEWRNINVGLIDRLEQRIGGFKDKRVLYLGGGPGQYSTAFARRGARVTYCFGWKIGHPHPPHGRLAGLLNGYPITLMIPDYSNDLVDKIFLIKGKV